MIIEIDDSVKEYRAAYNYIERTFPGDLHLHSAFLGVVFDRTLRMLQYDVDGEINMRNRSEDLVEKKAFLLNDEILGVAIRAIFKDFFHLLDFEEYLIIVADTEYVFSRLYDSIMGNGDRFEVITFRDNERRYLKKMFNETEIHYWRMYDVPVRAEYEIYNIRYSCFQTEDLEKVRFNPTDESLPSRYYYFSTIGMKEYSAWTLRDNDGNPIISASIMPYLADVAEIKLYVIDEKKIIPNDVVCFLKRIFGESLHTYNRAVIRTKNESKVIKKIIEQGKYCCISEERHLHFRKDT